MDRKEIIACLDVDSTKCVKGRQFIDLIEMGNPVSMAKFYSNEGIDRLVYLDISASAQKRVPNLSIVKEVVNSVSVPLTVGGGINSVESARPFIEIGVDKILINSAAIVNPYLIDEMAQSFGSSSIVVAIDALSIGGRWEVMVGGGRVKAGRSLFEWAQEAQERGAGEILYTAIDRDGTGLGYHLDSLKELRERVSIPIIASGGAGSVEHFEELFRANCANSALAASIFHRGEVAIAPLKSSLLSKNINVKI
ncbi:MAG: imidazole glycerol phosphate synthase cyclase subunit [Bacteroidales bacterium]